MKNFKTKPINNIYFVMVINHIDTSNGLSIHSIWNIRITCSYYFMKTGEGKLISLRHYEEPELKDRRTVLLNMSEYILELVE